MIKLKKSVLAEWKEKGISFDAKVNYLISNFTATQLASSVIELMEKEPAPSSAEKSFKKIAMTNEQFNQVFRIIGQNEDGTEQKRGRKKKEN